MIAAPPPSKRRSRRRTPGAAKGRDAGLVCALISTAIVAAIAATLGACSHDDGAPTPAAAAAAATAAPTATAAPPALAAPPATAARSPLRREAPAELVLDAEAAAAVAAPMAAQVLRLHVRPGDTVAAGAPIATVRMPEAAIAAARALAAAERGELVEARLTAVEGLLAEGLARAADRAELAGRAAELRAERAVALATLRGAGLGDPATLARNGGLHVLRAPVAGVITDVTAVVGELRGPGDGALARVSGGTSTRVMARWTSAELIDLPAVLQLGAERRALRRIAVAPRPDAGGAIAVWYELDGPPLAATRRARVVLGGAQ